MPATGGLPPGTAAPIARCRCGRGHGPLLQRIPGRTYGGLAATGQRAQFVQQIERRARGELVGIDQRQPVQHRLAGLRLEQAQLALRLAHWQPVPAGPRPAAPDARWPAPAPPPARRPGPPPAGRSCAAPAPAARGAGTRCRRRARRASRCTLSTPSSSCASAGQLEVVRGEQGEGPHRAAPGASGRPRPAPGRRRCWCRGRLRPAAPGCGRWRCAGCWRSRSSPP